MAYNANPKNLSFARTMEDLHECFDKWGVTKWDVLRDGNARSTNTAVEVIWTTKQGQRMRLSMNKHGSLANNIRTLCLCIDELRLHEVRGLKDVMREAYLQLEAPAKKRDPYEVLGVRPDAELDVALAAYRALAKKAHPDYGGSVEAMAELNEAIAAIQKERAA